MQLHQWGFRHKRRSTDRQAFSSVLNPSIGAWTSVKGSTFWGGREFSIACTLICKRSCRESRVPE
jgi:hypothetical protein